MAYFGLLWSIMVYFGLLWSIMVYFGLLWSTLVYFGLFCRAGFCPTCSEPNGEPVSQIKSKFAAADEFDEIGIYSVESV